MVDVNLEDVFWEVDKLASENKDNTVEYLSNSITDTMLASEISSVTNQYQDKLNELSQVSVFDSVYEILIKKRSINERL